MMIFALNTSFVAALTISAIARLVTYAATCASLPVLRRRSDVSKAAFRLPGGTGVAILSLGLIVWLLANVEWYQAKVATAAAAVGLLIFFSYKLYLRRSS
jgi:amino acid transporter